MKITIWINWDEQELKNEKEFDEMSSKMINDLLEDKEVFFEWLNDEFYPSDIWEMEMTDGNLADIKKKFHNWVEENVNDELENSGWEKYTIVY